ncbi:MAG: hypothetical protein QOE61_2051 [Micromonosporaceae bacterium]|jgi:peptidoglycan/LPS O-acetylase OafA/YrhL|nr:hypothetical protein [Micromonosporaceae bacterium]
MKLWLPGGTRTLDEVYSGRNNAFNAMRLLFALTVVVTHANILGFGHEGNPLGIPVDVTALAVAGFFVLSGFLITRSGRRTGLFRFAWHRVLRIFPGFWVCIGFTALVVAPLLWLRQHGTIHGIRHSGALSYIKNNFFTDILQPGISDLLAGVPYPYTLNGSLWTLKYELTCYVLVAALAVIGVLRRARIVVLLLTLVCCGLIVADFVSGPTNVGPLFTFDMFKVPVGGQYEKLYLLTYGTAFLLGAAAEMYRDVIPYNDVLGVSALVLVGVGSGLPLLGPALIAYAYLLLWLGMRLPQFVRRIGRRNDYSYGVYIYAFLVQQVLAILGVQRHGMAVYLSLSIVVTFALAILSWHLVEKPAMRLKDWTPPFMRPPAEERARAAAVAGDLPPAAHPAPAPSDPPVAAEPSTVAAEAVVRRFESPGQRLPLARRRD